VGVSSETPTLTAVFFFDLAVEFAVELLPRFIALAFQPSDELLDP